jgi:sec-independent protein translocase protein TatC
MSEKKLVLTDHLKALRGMLLISVGAVMIAFFVLFYTLREPLIRFILRPLHQREIEIIYTAVAEALMMQFKACLVAGVVAAMPVIVWQVWTFVSPALYAHEKRVFRILFFISALLFLAGVAFSYVTVFPMAIDLFVEAGENLAMPLWSVDEYFNFVLAFVLPFGVMFQLPVVLYMLARKGKVNHKQLSKARKYVVLAISVVAAILTPPDVVSQVLLGLPMWLLYEVGVQVARWAKPAPPREKAA